MPRRRKGKPKQTTPALPIPRNPPSVTANSKISTVWYQDLQLLSAYRRHNPDKWPSRDSKNPTEIRMANWIRSNLELLAANRLAPAQMRMIKDLVSGAQRTTQNSK